MSRELFQKYDFLYIFCERQISCNIIKHCEKKKKTYERFLFWDSLLPFLLLILDNLHFRD